MSAKVDITQIALSQAEIKTLRRISKHEPVSEQIIERHISAQRLYERGLIQRCHSERFPYKEPPYGIIEIPTNAFRLSDAGQQYLNRRREIETELRFTRTIAVWGGFTGTAAIIVEIWLHFL